VYRKLSPIYGSGERNEAKRRTKVSLGRTMMQALQLLQSANGTSWKGGGGARGYYSVDWTDIFLVFTHVVVSLIDSHW